MASLAFARTAAEGANTTGAFTNVAGNLIVAWVGWQDVPSRTPTSFSDLAGNVYQQVVGWGGPVVAFEATTPTAQTLYYCLSCKAFTNNTISASGLGGTYLVVGFEYTVPAGMSMILNPLAVAANNNQLGSGGSSPFPLAFSLNPILASTSELVIITEFLASGAGSTYAGFPATFGTRISGLHTNIQDNAAQSTARGPLVLTATQSVQENCCSITAGFCAGYSISGTASPGAKVSAYSPARLAYAGSATADGSGNYTITGVPAGDTYTITPYAGGVFSPVSASVAVTTANVTGINFTKTLSAIYTQLAADSGHRANENPIDPVNWSLITATGEPPLQIVNNEMEGSSLGHSGQNVSIYTGVAFPNDQYLQVQLDNIAASGNPANLLAVLRSTSGATTPSLIVGYAFRVFGPFGNGCGVGCFKQTAPGQIVTSYMGAGGGNAGRDNPCVIWPVNAGSLIRGELFGSQLTFLIDGVPVLVLKDTGDLLLTTNFIHLDAYRIAALTDVQMSLFAAGSITTPILSGNVGVAGATVSYSGAASGSVTADGSGNYSIPILADGSYTITPSLTGYVFSPASLARTVAGANVTGASFTAALGVYSVPDDRDWNDFPNLPVNVQGTETYTVPSVLSHPEPVDSRAQGAPIDSRIAPNIPENSREPGTFGPGE